MWRAPKGPGDTRHVRRRLSLAEAHLVVAAKAEAPHPFLGALESHLLGEQARPDSHGRILQVGEGQEAHVLLLTVVVGLHGQQLDSLQSLEDAHWGELALRAPGAPQVVAKSQAGTRPPRARSPTTARQ